MMSGSYNTTSLVENASKLSVEMVREVDTLSGMKRRLKDKLCRLQVEEKALRELLACEQTTTITTTKKTTRTKQNRGDATNSRAKISKVSTPLTTDRETCNIQNKNTSVNEEDVNKQILNLDVRIADTIDISTSSKEEIDTSTDEDMII